MKVWVVELRSPAVNYGEGDWTHIKAVFSAKDAAQAYAERLQPKAANITEALMCPSTWIEEFTLDVPDVDDETV